MNFRLMLPACAFACTIPMCAVQEARVEVSDAMRDELLDKAKAWGVPQPAPGAGLVKVWVCQSGGRDMYALGFRANESGKQALVGFDHVDLDKGLKVIEVPDSQDVSLKDVSPSSPFSGMNGVNFGLVTGIQLLRAGHPGTGMELIDKSLTAESGHHRSSFRSPAGEPPVVMLARSCLADAMNRISTANPDFPSIKRRVEAILKDLPQLKSEATDWALAGLEASVRHKPAAPGTIGSLIDAYVMAGRTEGALSMRMGEPTDAERALILKGFEAVPELLERRESKRFSNHVMQGFNNFVSYPMSEGQVVNAYLQRFANDEFGSNWLDRQKGHVAGEDAVLAWWKAASEIGEEAYVSKHTIKPKKDNEFSVSDELLRIAQERYPHLLPGFYERSLKTSSQSWPLASAFVDSDAPIGRKLELLEKAIATNHEAHRNTALSHLQGLRPDLADKHLIRLLSKAPPTARKEYWTDQDAALGRMVSRSENEEVWAAFHGLLGRADLGMRMELIDNLKPPKDAPPSILRSYYVIYDRFRNDRRIRYESSSEKFSGPGAGFPHSKLAMNDFVHMHWADWLDLEIEEPEEGSSPRRWKAYRASVRPLIEKSRN
jgi:hypothetical protein